VRSPNPQLERTPATLIVRYTQLSQGCRLAFGAIWLALVVPAGCVFLPALLIGASGFFAGGWEPELREFIGSWNTGLLILGLPFAFFVGVGVWMVGTGLRREHLEARVWTFDKADRSLIVTKEMRNRSTKTLRVEHVNTYPLPAPGSVQVRRIATTEHFENELVVTIEGKKIRGMRQRTMSGSLRQVAQEINDFLAT